MDNEEVVPMMEFSSEKVINEAEVEPGEQQEELSRTTIQNGKTSELEDDPIPIYATLAFIVVIILIGVPMWWKTTEVYRVPLPYAEIDALGENPIRVTIRMGLFVKSKERRDILLFELRKKFEHNFVFNLQLEDFSLDPSIASSAKTPAALETAIFKRYSLGIGDFVLIEWGKLEDDVLVTSERTAFISESATSLKIYQVLSSWILQEYKLKAMLGPKDMQTSKVRQLRLNTAPMQPNYDVLISVFNPRPDKQKIHWNVRAAAENYIVPFLTAMSAIANFTVKTQWVYEVDILQFLQEQLQDDTQLGRHYAVAEHSLPQIITWFEKKLGNQITDYPGIHLVVYVPECEMAPLRIYRNDKVRASADNVEAFTSAKWGGIIFANPSEDSIKKCLEDPDNSEVYVSAQDVMPVLLYQLRKIFDLENNIPLLDCSLAPYNSIEPRIWEVDTFIRSNTIYRIHSATLTLQSLIQLLGGIEYIVINDEVGAAIKDAYARILLAKQYLLDNNSTEAAAQAELAYVSAERAFFDPSMLALLYFPSEQKYAIYIPLFLPIMIPVIFSFGAISRYLKKRFAKRDKKKTE
ncbi:GPI transamidase component PIG-S-like isoform X1 [Topomyia yanbarensis]|uniref:GPI transamidase component PIG-S-like isoform X1 n=1 Tax=Topomyia yanbarensis TaxID=2498891 RepID=UPI00273CC725|nr:GPI transamidase component PIG-S-like isoform X1 [Topomyia yanbarensis]